LFKPKEDADSRLGPMAAEHVGYGKKEVTHVHPAPHYMVNDSIPEHSMYTPADKHGTCPHGGLEDHCPFGDL